MAKQSKNQKDKTKALNIKQELFCQLYVHSHNAMGNGTECYAEAYQIDITEVYDPETKKFKRNPNYDVCSVSASKLLRNSKIKDRITEILNTFLRDEVVDGEMAKVVRQDFKLDSKVAAIKEYNKLKKRVDDSPKNTVILSLSEILKQADAS